MMMARQLWKPNAVAQQPGQVQTFRPTLRHHLCTRNPEGLPRTDRGKGAGSSLDERSCNSSRPRLFTECIKPNSTWVLLNPTCCPSSNRSPFPSFAVPRQTTRCGTWTLPTSTAADGSVDDFGSPRSSAANFVQTVAKKRTKTSFLPILEFVTRVLNAYPASRSAAEKEGALYTVKTLDDVMLTHPMVKTNLESFMVQHVIPELSGQDRFLKFRAAEVIARLSSDMEWKNGASLESAFQGIMTCLGDSELPVRVQAAQAVTHLLDHDEVKDAMRPNAPRLMQELLNLSDEVELDVLTEPKTRVMDAFPQELLPFSTKLCEQLAQSYLRLVGAGIEAAKAIEEAGEVGREMNLSTLEEQGEEDKMFAAMSCLTTIWQVIDTQSPTPRHSTSSRRSWCPS
ncbi:hypothetical protein L7F22_005715 [Adiantum nelumboides]|nr:hypothetical protein [Adiantum nelumboides]